ncbi:MAG: hypothetical protein KGZ82_10750 [Bacteroidales bacterium]|nr:hypothetical protein [Bacteroidales bacterium]
MKQTITPSLVSRCGLGTPTVTIHARGIVFNKSATALLALHEGSRYVFELDQNEIYYIDRAGDKTDCFQVNTVRKTRVAETRNTGILPYLFEKRDSVTLEILEFSEGRRLLREMPETLKTIGTANGFDVPVVKRGRKPKN